MNLENAPLAIVRKPLQRKTQSPWALSLFITVGALLVWWTRSPLLGAIVASFYAASQTLQSGFWILGNDPSRVRACICFAFYLAAAFWQGAAMALLMGPIYFIGLVLLGLKGPALQQMEVTGYQLFGGIAFTAAIGLSASLAAALTGTRVWVHPTLQEGLRNNLKNASKWPFDPRQCNYGSFVLITSLMCPCLAVCYFLLIDFRSGLFTLIVLLGIVASGFGSYIWLASRILASHPQECWK